MVLNQIHDFHILEKGINSIGEKSLQIKKKKTLFWGLGLLQTYLYNQDKISTKSNKMKKKKSVHKVIPTQVKFIFYSRKINNALFQPCL